MSTEQCDYKNGMLPNCAPLALAYVPMQQNSSHRYETGEALIRGTLFPGLDLPFMNVVNTTPLADTPLGELMALHFVCDELRLYLDTHSSDKEAFELLKNILAMKDEAHTRYVRKYGPIDFDDVAKSSRYDWICNPWPWNYCKKEG